MRAWVVAALASGLLAGCLGPGEPAACEAGSLHTPWVDGAYLRTDPRSTWDTLVLAQGGDDPAPSAAPSGWSVASERISPDGGGNLSVLRVTPGQGMGALDLAYAYDDCEGPRSGTIHWDLAEPREGKSARPGQGVHVYTAGFWENGTLFYTNIKSVDHDWPHAGWYGWEGADPLPVYVYDKDRSEQPAYWKDAAGTTPVAGEAGLGYFTTIPGFNEALKGLSTDTVRVARLTPEQGYTRAGNEDHPLYGDALVFYIKVVDVVDLPCPLETARVCGAASTGFLAG
jgi:hypothetical protein